MSNNGRGALVLLSNPLSITQQHHLSPRYLMATQRRKPACPAQREDKEGPAEEMLLLLLLLPVMARGLRTVVRAVLWPTGGGWVMEFRRGGVRRGSLSPDWPSSISISSLGLVWCAQKGRGGERRRDAGTHG